MIFKIDIVKKGNLDGLAPSGGMNKFSIADEDADVKSGFLFGTAEKDKVTRDKGLFWDGSAVFKQGRGGSRDLDAGRAMGVVDQAAAVKSPGRVMAAPGIGSADALKGMGKDCFSRVGKVLGCVTPGNGRFFRRDVGGGWLVGGAGR